MLELFKFSPGTNRRRLSKPKFRRNRLNGLHFFITLTGGSGGVASLRILIFFEELYCVSYAF